jgi:hypothetical protein
MATNLGLKADEKALREAIQPQLAEVAAMLTSALQDLAREVRDEMTDRPADEVHAELRRRIEQAIPGVELDEAKLRPVAEEISAGTLTG